MVRREDAEEEEVVTRVNEEELEEFGAEIFEASEQFEEEVKLRPGTVSQIHDELSGTGLGPYTEMMPSVFFKLLGERMNARDAALEKVDELSKKEKDDKKKRERRKKKEKSPSSDDEGEEMEEEEEK